MGRDPGSWDPLGGMGRGREGRRGLSGGGMVVRHWKLEHGVADSGTLAGASVGCGRISPGNVPKDAVRVVRWIWRVEFRLRWGGRGIAVTPEDFRRIGKARDLHGERKNGLKFAQKLGDAIQYLMDLFFLGTRATRRYTDTSQL